MDGEEKEEKEGLDVLRMWSVLSIGLSGRSEACRASTVLYKLKYSTVHFTTLHYTTLHYTKLHYTT